MSDNHKIFLERLKANDPDRLRAAMLAGEKVRGDLCVLYAFHLELAKVPEVVSEPMIGDIRYQWWREAVDEIYAGKKVRAHEVATPLKTVLLSNNVPRFWIDKLIDGRHKDLDPTPFEDIDAAKLYAENTSGTLMRIAGTCVSDDADDAFLTMAGTAWGLTGLCRAYGYYHGSMLTNIAFKDLLAAARKAYEDARASISADIMPACAYAGLIPKYLAKMSKPGFDPKIDQAVISPFTKQVRQFGVAVKGTI